MNSVLEVDKLSVKFDNEHVLNNLSFSIKKGEIVGIVGRSGIGKSTILNSISNVISYEGKIIVEDKSLLNAIKNQDIAYVFQQPALLPWRNVKDNILLPIEISNNNDLSVSDDLLKTVNLIDAKNKFPHELSGGMKTRVEIARALIQNPKILLLDEAFSDLDQSTKEELYLSIEQVVSERKICSLLVTHNILESLILCDRIFVLSGKPASFVKEFKIDYNRPRIDKIFTDEFRKIYKEIIQRI